MKTSIFVLSASLFLCETISGQSCIPGCDNLVVTSITMSPSNSVWEMNITIENTCDTCCTDSAAVYLNLAVIRTVFPFDTIADCDCSSFVVPNNNSSFTYSIESFQSNLPARGTYRVQMRGICDSIPISDDVGHADCNNIHLGASTYYLSYGEDTIDGKLFYLDFTQVIYPGLSLTLSDTSIIATPQPNANSFILLANPDNMVVPFYYRINFKTPVFAHNTAVNGYLRLFAQESPTPGVWDSTVYCFMPLTIILQNPGTCDSTIRDTITVTVNDTTQVVVYDTTALAVYDSIAVSDTLVINVNLTGIPPDDVNTIRVYPNPAFDHLYIDNGNYAIMTGYSLKITNGAGQIVFQSHIAQQQFLLDLNAFGGHGTYFLSIHNPQNEVAEHRKIILQ